MKIAFDYGGILSSQQWARDMARALLKAGHQVYCITAVPTTWIGTGKREKEVSDLDIPFTNVFVTPHEYMRIDPNGAIFVNDQQAWAAGLGKAKVMKEIGCEILIDDLPMIILAVRSLGFIGLHAA